MSVERKVFEKLFCPVEELWSVLIEEVRDDEIAIFVKLAALR